MISKSPMRLHRIMIAFTYVGAILTCSGPALAVEDAVLVELIATGQIEAARTQFSQRSPTPVDWLFFEGRVAKADGRLNDAIASFREVLRQDPSYVAARRELAHSLLLAQEYRAAAAHFNDLLQNDPATDQHEGYIYFLNQIDRQRPFSLGAHFAIISSSNVNRGSSQDRFKPGGPGGPSFEITSRAEPGTGAEFGLLGDHLWRAEDGYRWTLNWGLSGRKFEDDDENSVTATLRLQYGRLNEKTRWHVGPFARRTWAATGDDSAVLGLGFETDRRLDARITAFLAGHAEYQDHLTGDESDGPRYSARAGLVRGFDSGTFAFGARIDVSRPETEHHAYNGQTLFAHGSRSWAGGFNGGLGLEIGRRDYLGTFPLAGEARDDRFYEITATAQHDAIRIRRFSPRLRCKIGENDSNIAFYDYDITECTLEIATRF